MAANQSLWICLIAITIVFFAACKQDPVLECEETITRASLRFDSLHHPAFIPEKEVLKNEVTLLFMLRDSVQKIQTQNKADSCLIRLELLLEEQMAYYKAWTNDITPYLPAKKWEQLSTIKDKNAFLQLLPAMYEAGKKRLQTEKVNIREDAIRELEAFYLFLQKENHAPFERKDVENARLAVKDFLAFLISHKQ